MYTVFTELVEYWKKFYNMMQFTKKYSSCLLTHGCRITDSEGRVVRFSSLLKTCFIVTNSLIRRKLRRNSRVQTFILKAPSIEGLMNSPYITRDNGKMLSIRSVSLYSIQQLSPSDPSRTSLKKEKNFAIQVCRS